MKRRPDVDTDEIRRNLKARAADLFTQVWGAPSRPKASEWRPKRKAAGDDPRAMIMTGPDKGLWIDHRTGEGGDLLDFVAVHLCGLPDASADFPRVLAEAAAWLGRPAKAAAPQAPTAPDPRQMAADVEPALKRLDAALVPLQGAGLIYWTKARALDPPPERLVMSLPGGVLPRGTGKLPSAWREAVVICARDASGRLRAAQRILILPDGSGRDRTRPKYSLGPVGDHPPVFPARTDDAASGVLVLAEGPETSGALWSAVGCSVLVCCGSLAGQIRRLHPGSRALVAAEADAAGSPAALTLSAALKEARAHGVALAPIRLDAPPGSKLDAADVIRRPGGQALLRQLVAEASAALPWPVSPGLPKRDPAQAPKPAELELLPASSPKPVSARAS